jgi:hypothetical protein
MALATVLAMGQQAVLAVRWAHDGRAPCAKRATVGAAALSGGAVLVEIPAGLMWLDLPVTLLLLVAATTTAVVLAGRWLG